MTDFARIHRARARELVELMTSLRRATGFGDTSPDSYRWGKAVKLADDLGITESELTGALYGAKIPGIE